MSLDRRRAWCCPLLWALVFPLTAHGQSSEIVVNGQPLPAAKGDVAYDIVSIDRDRLGGTASNRIEDALKDVAGLQQFRRTDSRSANATSQGATLRGLGGNASSRALLVLDGVPQSDPFGGWVTWPAFQTIRLGQARVTRGGGSGVYGSGALSGTIELASVGPEQVGGLSGDFGYGSRNAVDTNALLGGRLGDGFGFISASYARSDGFVPIIQAQRGRADIVAPYDQASVAARGVIPVSPDTELQASALAFTDRRTRGTILSENGGTGADASVRLVHSGRWAWQALAYLQARKFKSRAVSLDAARATVSQTVDQFSVPSTGLGARLEIRPPLGEALELRLGGDVRRTVGETREFFTYVASLPTRLREAGGDSDTIGAFAELSASLGALTLTGGGRLDRWSIRDGRLIEHTIATGALIRNDRPANRQGTEPTGRIGLAYRAGSLTLRAAGYLGWRLPTLNELYRPFRIGADATAANPALQTERMRGAEVGLDWTPIDHASLRATLFSNRLTRAIANVTLGTGPGNFPGVGFVATGGAYRQRQNLDAIRSNGIEFDAQYGVGDWKLAASYAYADAKVRASGAARSLNGLRPAQVPKHLASATIGWRWFSATGRHVSAQFEDDGNLRTLRAATTLDATVNVPLGHRITVTLRGENVTNVQVDAAISGIGVVERATPRTLWVGLRLRSGN